MNIANNGQVIVEISKEVQNMLDFYEIKQDVAILNQVMDERIAHTIDVIFKESLRTLNEDCKEYKQTGELNFAAFETPYELFDMTKVFFLGNNTTWLFPITIINNNPIHSNFITHNHFYIRGHERLNKEGLLCNFYQDIDIFGTDESWKTDLLKALYITVTGAFEYWKVLSGQSNVKFC